MLVHEALEGLRSDLQAFALHLLLSLRLQHLSDPPIVYHKRQIMHLKALQKKLYDHSSCAVNEHSLLEISASCVVDPLLVLIPIVCGVDSVPNFVEWEGV